MGAEELENGFSLNLTAGDEALADVLKLELTQGRYFSEEFSTDTGAIVINEEALKLLGYNDPIGKKLNNWGTPRRYYDLIGVVKDIYYESKHQHVHPMGILLFNENYWMDPGVIAVRVKPGNYKEIISRINDLWDRYDTGIPFSYAFFDEQYNQLYNNEMQTRKLFMVFSFLAIFIACLGLLGLASYLAQQKTREVGIRKTYGAPSTIIALQMSKHFLQWVVLANLIAWPLSWLFFDHWLNNFAYRAGIHWWYFVLAGIISLIIALLTVSYQTIRASLANPVEALRYE